LLLYCFFLLFGFSNCVKNYLFYLITLKTVYFIFWFVFGLYFGLFVFTDFK
jgi:hypothetical protein